MASSEMVSDEQLQDAVLRVRRHQRRQRLASTVAFLIVIATTALGIAAASMDGMLPLFSPGKLVAISFALGVVLGAGAWKALEPKTDPLDEDG